MLKKLEEKRGITLIITLIIALTIFYISSLKFDNIPGGLSFLSVAYHFLAFFTLNFFLSISLVQGKDKRIFVIAFLMSVLYGITDEIHQFFVPGRAMSVGDILVDSAGIFLASALYFLIIIARKD